MKTLDKKINKYKAIINKAENGFHFRRTFLNFFLTTIIFLFSLLLIIFTAAIILTVIVEGLKDFHLTMITHSYNENQLNSLGYTGLAGPIVSTLIMILFVLCFSMLISIFSSIYIHEYIKNKRIKSFILYFCSICNGIPSIIFGLFGFLIFVYTIHFSNARYSILSSSLTLTLVVLPTMILGSYDSIKLVSKNDRMVSYALGATKLQTIFKIILPAAIYGILHTTIICITRAIGEAAPVLLTIGQNNELPHSVLSSGNTLTVLIFTEFKSSSPISFIFVTSFLVFFIVMLMNLFVKIIMIVLVKYDLHNTRNKKFFEYFNDKYIYKRIKRKIQILYYSIVNVFINR